MKTMKMLAMMLVVAISAAAVQATAAIFIDVDGGDAPAPDSQGRYWAGTGGLAGYLVTNAVDQYNNPTTVDINAVDGFHNGNSQGTMSSSLTDWDADVTEDSLYIGDGNNTAQIRFEDLVAGVRYDLTFYGSRNSGDNRSMDVTIGGTTQSYNAGNLEGLTIFPGVAADDSGDITADFAISAGNTYNYAYLGAIEIEIAPKPTTILIDFDGDDAPTPDSQGRYWAGTAGVSGYLVTNAVDQNNNATSVDINAIDAFQSSNSQGTTSSSLADWDAQVTSDSLWIGAAEGNPVAEIRIEGLLEGGLYDLTFYASRVTTGSRIMDVTIGTTTQSYDAVNEGLTTFAAIAADANGDITVQFDLGSTNNWAYLGAMAITPVPEPSSVTLLILGLGLLGLATWRRRK